MQIQLKQFKGPLELLLNLIENQELDISEISVCSVADQFINFVKNDKSILFESQIRYLEIASRLIILKTKLLSPYLVAKEGDLEEEDLVDQLKRYKKYLEAAKIIAGMWYDPELTSFSVIPSKKNKIFTEDIEQKITITPKMLYFCMQRINYDLEEEKKEVTKFKRILNVKTRIALIIDYLKRKESLLFSELHDSKFAKDDLVVNFIAMLELSKTNLVTIRQEKIFEDICITKYEQANI